jgi:hypothetical protein
MPARARHPQPLPGAIPAPTEPTTDDRELISVTVDEAPASPAVLASDASLADVVEVLNRLCVAVNTIGLQQQWVTDTIGQMHGLVTSMVAGGNPIATLGKLLGGRR